jgi:hypothetical protein
MKHFPCLSIVVLLWFSALSSPRVYVGSTPAHAEIRSFLQISATDSIDFIRWKLEIDAGTFKISAQYGMAGAGTPGFSNEKRVAFEGQLTQVGNYYGFRYRDRLASMVEVNTNMLHFVDHNKRMLIGNGGYSYVLNSTRPVDVDVFNISAAASATQNPLVFEGRTPCQTLAGLLGMEKSAACNKMKWYFLLYTDSVTGKPSYFLMGGLGYKKETMTRGRWQIETAQNGRITYRLNCERWTRPLNLLKGDDNILFFVDANGRPLVGNEDFSYTLNRRTEEYPRIKDPSL